MQKRKSPDCDTPPAAPLSTTPAFGVASATDNSTSSDWLSRNSRAKRRALNAASFVTFVRLASSAPLLEFLADSVWVDCYTLAAAYEITLRRNVDDTAWRADEIVLAIVLAGKTKTQLCNLTRSRANFVPHISRVACGILRSTI